MPNNLKQGLDSLKGVLKLLDDRSPSPRCWYITLAVVAVISVFSYSEGKFEFGVRAYTLITLVMMWMPYLLKLLALMGGGIKTAAGEIKTSGLAELLPQLLGVINEYEREILQDQAPTTQALIRTLRDKAEKEIAATVEEGQSFKLACQNLATDYDALRKSQPSGLERTQAMSGIATQMRVLAKKADYQTEDLQTLYQDSSGGNRVLTLSAIQAVSSPEHFPMVLKSIGQSESAFEQHLALRVAQTMVGDIDEEAKRQLKATIEDQQSGGEGKWITKDSDRYRLSQRIVQMIGG
ncbi:hypothetical protein DV711_10935 [Motiliproteus coralliicola]|uniref:Uncharacterized protein n=1 Tax=Motiliproteus coralliicola TaxID=2283196 RepID=A0A369WJ08_9GAMM|nr:hypothetical protein [Motiliproteus coralliicola]RDE19405.1 hypothetical protein DV711_10935 [Motiliproteus coralliicola]